MAQTINLILNALATGTVDAVVVTYSPAITSLVNNRIYAFVSTGANTSTTPTLNINGLGAKTIKKKGGQALVSGDIGASGSQVLVSYRSTGTYFELINPASDTDDQTLTQVLTEGNVMGNAQQIQSTDGFSIFKVIDNQVLAEFNDGSVQNQMYLQNTLAGLLFTDTGTYASGGIQADINEAKLIHTAKATLDAPLINLPNETASRYLYLDASKNIDTKTTAQVLSDIGAQPLDTQLTEIAALNPANDDFIQEKAGVLTNRTPAQVSADLTANLLIGYQGYAMSMNTIVQLSPADATTYYFGSALNTASTVDGDARLSMPKAGNIKAIFITVTNQGTIGSGQTSSIYFRLNQTTDTLITSSFVTNAVVGVFSNTSLNIAVAQNDTFEIKWITPNWSTNPTNVRFTVTLYIE